VQSPAAQFANQETLVPTKVKVNFSKDQILFIF
jgi:hypothetical protein